MSQHLHKEMSNCICLSFGVLHPYYMLNISLDAFHLSSLYQIRIMDTKYTVMKITGWQMLDKIIIFSDHNSISDCKHNVLTLNIALRLGWISICCVSRALPTLTTHAME